MYTIHIVYISVLSKVRYMAIIGLGEGHVHEMNLIVSRNTRDIDALGR